MSASGAPQVVVSSSSSSQGNVTIQQGGVPTVELPVFGIGIISGVVTDGKTGQPLEGALVQLAGGSRGASAGRPREMTDARGRFLFTHLAPFPDYAVSVSKPGYLDGGCKRTPGVPVAPRIGLRDSEWFTEADVTLWKPASITGTVMDDQGAPVVGVPVRALASVRVAGRVRHAAGPSTITDDRGIYRLAGLSPGEYIVHVPSVQVTIPDGGVTPSRPTVGVSPGGSAITSTAPEPDGIIRTESGAGLLVGTWSVKSITSGGRELRDAPLTFDQGPLTDVEVTLTDRPATLQGTLSSASGQATSDYYIVLFPADRALWHPLSPRIRVMRPAADGAFTTRDLLPGTYRLAALTDVEDEEWRTRAFLESIFDASLALTVEEATTTRQDVRIR